MDARYRLAPMRDARARHERVQKGDLAGALREAEVLAGDLEEAARRVARARGASEAATATRDRALARGVGSTTLTHVEHYLCRLRRELEAARGELARAEARHRGQLEAVDAAQGRLVLARAEREIIERHFAAWRAERHKRAERRAD
jgi:hypothetical protein